MEISSLRLEDFIESGFIDNLEQWLKSPQTRIFLDVLKREAGIQKDILADVNLAKADNVSLAIAMQGRYHTFEEIINALTQKEGQ
jgi:hypothetical protein